MSAGLTTFLPVSVLASHWLKDVADGMPTTGKTNKTPLTYSEALAASQTTFILDKLYSTCVAAFIWTRSIQKYIHVNIS